MSQEKRSKALRARLEAGLRKRNGQKVKGTTAGQWRMNLGKKNSNQNTTRRSVVTSI